MRKVLVISYYWPPSGGSGVQRWVKFAKYLPQEGWEPVIYAPENPEYPIYDNTMGAELPDSLEVIKRSVFRNSIASSHRDFDCSALCDRSSTYTETRRNRYAD